MSVWKDLKIIKKTTMIYELPFTKNGICIDLTDWTIYYTLKASIKDEDALAKINKKITSHIDALGGKTIIELTPADTDIPVGIYYYSIDYKDPDGNIGVLFEGRIKIAQPIRKTKD